MTTLEEQRKKLINELNELNRLIGIETCKSMLGKCYIVDDKVYIKIIAIASDPEYVKTLIVRKPYGCGLTISIGQDSSPRGVEITEAEFNAGVKTLIPEELPWLKI